MAFNLSRVLRALLLSTSEPLSIKDLQAVFTRFHAAAEAEAAGEDAPAPAPADELEAELYQDVPALVTAAQIRAALEELSAEFRHDGRGWLVQETAEGYRLVCHTRFARWVRLLRAEPAPARLSGAALETLAVVAYRQPVTRAQVEAIRGVASDGALARLVERELVRATGRADLPGRPWQYATTERFLTFVGVKSLSELPASDVLSPRQIEAWLAQAGTTRPPDDAAMGLPLENAPAATAQAVLSTVTPSVAVETPAAPVAPVSPVASASAPDSPPDEPDESPSV